MGESLGAEPHNQETAAEGFAVALRILSLTGVHQVRWDVWTSVN